MQRSDRRQYLTASSYMITLALAHLDELVHALETGASGYPTGRPGSSGVSDRTATAALQNDVARQQLRELDRLVKQAHSTAQAIDGIRQSWTATAKQLEPMRRLASATAGEECEVMARYGEFEPAAYKRTTVKGNLARPMRLGRWAYDRILATGKLPSEADVRAHLRGDRLRRQA